MIVETFFEVGRFALMVGILGFVGWAGWSRGLLDSWAWRFSITAFLLLFFGATIDVVDDYEVLKRWFGWRDTMTLMVLEKGVGYLGGFCFILLGALFWLPKMDALTSSAKAAQQASKEKDRLIANMSHELRTPLNAILGFSEIISAQLLGRIENARYVEYGVDIHQSAEHLLAIINDLLDLSRIEADALNLDIRPFDADQLVAGCVSMLADMAADKGVCLSHIREPAPPFFLDADKTRVRQVLINVLANAVKFTPPGGEIEVGVSTGTGGRPMILVRDTGIGMSEEDLRTAFLPFGQIVSDDHQAAQGTGLGLPIARLLMQAHGGELDVSSRLGEGTQVVLRFPLHSAVRSPLAVA